MKMFPGAKQAMKAKTLDLSDEVWALDFPSMRWAELSIDNEAKVHVGATGTIEQSLELAFKSIKANASAAQAPRYYLVNNEVYMTLIIWLAEAKVSDKFKYTHSVAQVKEIFAGEWKEFRPEDLDELTYQNWYDATREMTHEERQDAMTYEERQRQDIIKAENEARTQAPMLLPGMNTMGVSFAEDLLDIVKTGLSKGECVSMKIGAGQGGPDFNLLQPVKNVGKDIASVAGDLPPDEPAYVLYRAEDGHYDFLVWAPDTAPAKLKMKVSTMKSGAMNMLTKYQIFASPTELSDESDLKDFQKDGRSSKAMANQATAPHPEKKLPPGVPPGAMMMPGMGMAMKLPGMGK